MNCARYIYIRICIIVGGLSFLLYGSVSVLGPVSAWLLKQKRVAKFIAILFVIYLSYKYAYEMNEC